MHPYITNIIPHSPDDGFLQAKHLSVHFASQYISTFALITFFSNFSLYCRILLRYLLPYIYK